MILYKNKNGGKKMDFLKLDEKVKAVLDFLNENESDTDTISYNIDISLGSVGMWYKGEI